MFYSVKNYLLNNLPFSKLYFHSHSSSNITLNIEKGLGCKTLNVIASERRKFTIKKVLMTSNNRVVVKNEAINYLEISLGNFLRQISVFPQKKVKRFPKIFFK